jgi:hypothetical protein
MPPATPRLRGALPLNWAKSGLLFEEFASAHAHLSKKRGADESPDEEVGMVSLGKSFWRFNDVMLGIGSPRPVFVLGRPCDPRRN